MDKAGTPSAGKRPVDPDPVDRACLAVLKTAAPGEKASRAREAGEIVKACNRPEGVPCVPERPARPDRPALVAPGDVPRRRLGSAAGRIALLHAIAHIEFNAIDLAIDMAVRFWPAIAALGLDPFAFRRDWIGIAAEEAIHFGLVEQRLQALGAHYGDCPAHNGLWEAAADTAGDVLARLAIAPLVLEARGLDVTPTMITKLESVGDIASADILKRIYRDEIGHVAIGNRWFRAVCKARGEPPAAAFRQLVETHFPAGLKSPFNHTAREQAGLDLAFYAAWCPDEMNS